MSRGQRVTNFRHEVDGANLKCISTDRTSLEADEEVVGGRVSVGPPKPRGQRDH